MKRNKGFSMVEVIIVVVIIGIVSTGVMVGLSSVNKNNTDEGFQALASSLDTARYKTLSSDNTEFYIYVSDGYYYSCIYDASTKEKITEKLFSCNIPLYIYSKDENKTVKVTKDSSLRYNGLGFDAIIGVWFNNSTGAFMRLDADTNAFKDETVEIYSDNGNKRLYIYKNGRTRVE